MNRTEYMRQWRAKNKEKNAEYQSKYYKEYRKQNKEKLATYNNEWREANKEHNALQLTKARLKRKYNITIEEYEALLESQDHSCKVCGKHATENHQGKLYIDHCHTTGKVRGLLCMKCNSALGLLNDDPEIIGNLLEYLK